MAYWYIVEYLWNEKWFAYSGWWWREEVDADEECEYESWKSGQPGRVRRKWW